MSSDRTTRSGSTPSHNLPAPRSSFVGREREILEVEQALATTRLLTLTGAGGSGKTRLALEAARVLLESYPDGVWFIELATLSDEELVPQAVAETLGIAERPGELHFDTLADALRDKGMLLILDNCEHLVEAVARLVGALLDYCTALRILATSREGLGVNGEVIRLVPPLPVPDLQHPPTTRELEITDSLRLFSERAHQRDFTFDLTERNAPTVAEICRRLEGLPLAIELAAARVGTLSIEHIAERLEDPLALLTRGARTAVDRQRTLKGTLDWSHELLSGDERVLFRRLAVFTGGWTLEAAESVCSGKGIEKKEVMDLLSGLVEKSLVLCERAAEGGARYRMLEPVGQYAKGSLEESDEIGVVGRWHARFFLALADETASELRGPEQGIWLRRLETEHGNFRTALAWTLARGDTRLGLRLSGALFRFWRKGGHLSEGARWLEEALSKDGREEPDARAAALYGLGVVLEERSDFGGAQACFEEALDLYEELGDRSRAAESLASLGWTALLGGDVSGAKGHLEKSLTADQESENWGDVPRILSGLALIAFDGGDFERAQGLWAEALRLNREHGETLGATVVLTQMGYAELAQENLERAATLFEEAQALGRELRHQQTMALGLSCLGIVANLQGDPGRAKKLLNDSLAIYLAVDSGDLPLADLAQNVEGLAEVAGALDQGGRAARLWGAAAAMRRGSRPWLPTERMLHEPRFGSARSALDEETWDTAFAEGKAMTTGQVFEYALCEEEPSETTLSKPEKMSAPMGHPAGLTDRELEVLKLVASGMTSSQAAEELFLSPRTVNTHLTSIYHKIGASSRSAATRFAMEHGIA